MDPWARCRRLLEEYRGHAIRNAIREEDAYQLENLGRMGCIPGASVNESANANEDASAGSGHGSAGNQG